MKINLKKVEDLEKAYYNRPICTSTLNNLLNIVISADDTVTATKSYMIAYSTLVNLRVIEDENEPPKPQHLNS